MTLMESLIRLNLVDAQLRGLRSRLTTAERYLKGQQAKQEEHQGRQQELKSRKKQVKAAIGNKEIEVQAIDARLEKLRNELNEAVTNKVYSAVLTEMNTVKLERKEVEDGMIELMEQVETTEQELADTEGLIQERKGVCKLAQAQYDERKSEIGERLTELEQERKQAAESIPPSELAMFNKLADDYDGEAMAPIVEVSRRNREYVCGECSLQIPFERVSNLLCGGDSLILCAACKRILFMEEETRGALVKK